MFLGSRIGELYTKWYLSTPLEVLLSNLTVPSKSVTDFNNADQMGA